MKTTLSLNQVRDFLTGQCGDVTHVEQMIEGEESQALSFVVDGSEYVIRINPRIEGFLKDDYAYKKFATAELPVPEVVTVGHIDPERAYCVSEKLPGITLQNADEAEVMRLLEPLTEVWRAIGETDISDTSGYGDFDADGIGKYKTWHDYLVSILDCDWQKVTERLDRPLLNRLTEEFESLLPSCPEERRLVHGDFGSNNLLVDKARVTGVLDWADALYGDPLLDIAGAYFWRTWLMCTAKSAEYWDERLVASPYYRRRIRCYQLGVALREIYDHALDGDAETLDWLQGRSEQILAETV